MLGAQKNLIICFTPTVGWLVGVTVGLGIAPFAFAAERCFAVVRWIPAVPIIKVRRSMQQPLFEGLGRDHSH